VMLDSPFTTRHQVARAKLGFARWLLPVADLFALALGAAAVPAFLPTIGPKSSVIASLLPIAIMVLLYAHAKLQYLQGQSDGVISRFRFIIAPALTISLTVLAAAALKEAIHVVVHGQDSLEPAVGFTIAWTLSAGGTGAALRQLAWFALVSLRNPTNLTSRVAIVGAGPIGSQLAQIINRHFTSELRIVGIYDERLTRVPKVVEDHAVSSMDALIAAVHRNEIDKILVALPLSAEERLLSLLQTLKTLPVDVSLIPDNLGLRLMGTGEHAKRGLDSILLNILRRPLSVEDLAVKRAFDILASAALLLFFAPVMIAVGLAVVFTSAGPVFFRQPRAGLNDKVFHVLKFRTMYVEQSDLLAQQQTRRNDPRITRIGHFLRKTSIDELPQLINVLLGDMSLVGPRPHATGMQIDGRLCQEVLREYAHRHRVKPGITGWAQVCGLRGAVDDPALLTQRIERDIYYIDHWSLGFDLKILLLTLPEVLRSRNAF